MAFRNLSLAKCVAPHAATVLLTDVVGLLMLLAVRPVINCSSICYAITATNSDEICTPRKIREKDELYSADLLRDASSNALCVARANM